MLKLESISKTFSPGTPRELTVLTDVSLEIARGEFAVLLGSNGSGKSTLLKIIAGYVQPDGGRVRLDNVELTDLQSHKRAKYLYYVHQAREANLVSHLTVSEVFMLAMAGDLSLLRILSEKRWRERIKSKLFSFGRSLENRLDEQVWSLSGGEHQILTILVAAESINNNGDSGNVLILDEHVSHLDPASSDMVMALTTELASRYSMTILMVTHNIQIASQFGERILILKSGTITFDKKFATNDRRDPRTLLQLIS